MRAQANWGGAEGEGRRGRTVRTTRLPHLPVVRVDAVARHRLLHSHQRVRCHLVAEAAAPAVNHHAHLLPSGGETRAGKASSHAAQALVANAGGAAAHLSDAVNAHFRGSRPVEHLVHHLDLRVVVPRAQRAQLGQPSLLGASADLRTVERAARAGQR